jgi:hypothetical protein
VHAGEDVFAQRRTDDRRRDEGRDALGHEALDVPEDAAMCKAESVGCPLKPAVL